MKASFYPFGLAGCFVLLPSPVLRVSPGRVLDLWPSRPLITVLDHISPGALIFPRTF